MLLPLPWLEYERELALEAMEGGLLSSEEFLGLLFAWLAGSIPEGFLDGLTGVAFSLSSLSLSFLVLGMS